MPKYNYSDYTINFFKDVDTENKSYILGLLFADGNVYKDSNKIKIKLKKSDSTYLEKIKKVLRLENPIICREYPCKEKFGFSKNSTAKSATLVFCHKEIKKDLVGWGCVPNKSLVLKPPTGLPEHLIPHFIRGYFDGDGHVAYYEKPTSSGKGTYHIFRFEIVGTKEVLEYICKSLSISLERIRKDPRYKCYSIYSTNPELILEVYGFLYQNSSLYLDRKRDIFEKIKNIRSDYTSKRALKVQHKETGKTFDSLKEGVAYYKMSYSKEYSRLYKQSKLATFELI